MCNNLKCTFSANVTFRDCRSAAFATFSEKPCQQSRLRLFFLPIHNFDMCLHDGFVQLQQKNNPNRNVDFLVNALAFKHFRWRSRPKNYPNARTN